MRSSRLAQSVGALVVIVLTAAPLSAQPAKDLATCADERVKTTLLTLPQLAAAEAACARALAGAATEIDRQKAAFFRGLMRFLHVVQQGMAPKNQRDGSQGAYSPPTLAQVNPALRDIETAIGIEGPLKGDALALRATINQTIGRHPEARADVEQAMRAAPKDATPFVQRALEHERAGDAAAALADLDRALELDPKSGVALSARGDLLRRLGWLARARADFAQTVDLGPPFRRLALIRKSGVELRAGDLRAAYDDLVAAARETADLPKADAAEANSDLLVRAGDLALDHLKDADIAEKHYREAARLTPKNWTPQLGLARVEERRGDRAKAAAIYRRILAATKSTPNLLERILASLRLKQLTQPRARDGAGFFRSSLDAGVAPSKASPDGLKRVAFIIGSSDYAQLSSLPNARRDAAVMASALADMGFDVVEIAENLSQSDLKAAPAYIAERAADADIAFVFYAGHGVETGGVNYLIPVDASPESDSDLSSKALPLSALTSAASKARRGALVIIDACRDDPFVEARAAEQSRSAAGRSAPQAAPAKLHAGLAATTPALNSVVFHSTQPGQVALDGDGLDSPFVRALLETLSTPGRPLDAVVKETTTRVSERTQGRQTPAAYGAAPAVALLPTKAAQ